MLGLILIFAFGGLIFYSFFWKLRGLPPGPIPLPFLGNSWYFNKFGLAACLNMFRQKYGDLYTIWFGGQPYVTFNTFELIQEAFVKNADAFSGKPKNKMVTDILRDGEYGIILTDGPLWKEHRRFTLQFLKNFGLGKNLMQERVLNEVVWVLEIMKKQLKDNKNGGEENDEISLQKSIEVAVGSVINSLLFGYSFQETSLEEFYTLKNLLTKAGRIFASTGFWILRGDKFDILRKLPFFNSIYNNLKKEVQGLKDFLYNQIDERMEKIDFTNEDSEPTDYVEAFLRQQKKLENSGESYHTFSKQQLFGNVFDLWIAGQETTYSTLSWLILYLMTNPEAQKKLHEELTKVIGSDRIITNDDKNNLPYLTAVIAESQRLCNLLPLNTAHRLMSDVKIQGYNLKENTIVVPQISQIFYDDAVFPEHEKFKPERFLTSDGKFQSRPELVPFNVGKRACLGEPLARLELFLFAANLFNHFEITNVESKPASLKRIHGLNVQPEPFVCKLIPRF